MLTEALPEHIFIHELKNYLVHVYLGNNQMGMRLVIRSVSDKNIDTILLSPALIWRLLAPEDPDIYLDSLRASDVQQSLAEHADNIPDLMLRENENTEIDLDKAWQGIHYCLNQTAYDAQPPMDFLTFGGTECGDMDIGYGAGRFLKSDSVKEIHTIIDKVSTEALRANYDPIKMDQLDIYPTIWESDGEDGFDYIHGYFQSLSQFIAMCAQHKFGILVYLT